MVDKNLLTVGAVIFVVAMFLLINPIGASPGGGGGIFDTKTYKATIRIEGTAFAGEVTAVLIEPTTFWIMPVKGTFAVSPATFNIQTPRPLLIGFDGGTLVVDFSCGADKLHQEIIVEDIGATKSKEFDFKFRVRKENLPCAAALTAKLYEGQKLESTLTKTVELD